MKTEFVASFGEHTFVKRSELDSCFLSVPTLYSAFCILFSLVSMLRKLLLNFIDNSSSVLSGLLVCFFFLFLTLDATQSIGCVCI